MAFELITFDVYSASFDIEGSLVPKLAEVYGSVDPSQLVAVFRVWRQKQMEYMLINNSLDKGRFSFRYITGRALRYSLQKHGLPVPDTSVCDALVHAWTELKLWPEAAEVIKEVKNRGYKIAMLSNGDEDMLNALNNQPDFTFDYVFSADEAGCYKPHPTFYELPFRRLEIGRNELLHVAGSPTDAMGAKAARLTCAWSNRFHDVVLDENYTPDYQFKDLSGVLQIL